MATVDRHTDHTRRDLRSGPGAGRRRGQDSLAEVIMIRPAHAHRNGLIGSLVTMARVFASSRAQATSVRSTPRPPSSPASLTPIAPPAPSDTA